MRYWLAVFVVLILILDVMWMLDGFLNLQYSNSLGSDSYTNEHTTFTYRLFADKPLVNLYYRVIISLLVLVGVIMIILFMGRITNYRSLLDASNLKYRSLFMGMQSGFSLRRIIRDDQGNIKDIRFLEINPAFRKHTGLDEIEFKDKSVHEVFTEIGDDLLEDYDKIARYGGSFTKIHQAKGLNKILRISAYQHAEDVFATFVEDITKEKQTEDELQESMQLQTILLNTINEGVFYIDQEMKILWINKQLQEFLAKDESEILGKKCHEVWYGRDHSCENCPALEACTKKQMLKPQTVRVLGKYLQIYSNPVYNADNELKGIVQTVYDLTDWQSALDKLKSKQEHLNMALEVGKMTAWEWNSSNDIVKLEQSKILTNRMDNSLTLDQIVKYLHPDDRGEFIRQKDLILAGKLEKLGVEARVWDKSENWIWFNLLGKIVEVGIDKAYFKMIGITYNIDNLKKIALKLKKTNLELTELKEKLEKEVEIRVAELREKDLIMIRQSRQAAMGEMIGNIAHQWRQPLNSISVIIQDFLDAWDYGELTRKYLENKIELSMSVLNHMSQTIDDFRDFFSPDNRPQEFALDNQIKKTINILKDMYASQGIEIKPDLIPVTIESYAREFSQVLINIFNNSKDALLERNISNPAIRISMLLDTDWITIQILDNAGGIEESILDKVFDPYFTTKQASNGTGVGLYMSKNIIEKHMNGKIYAENAETGALFTIELPRS